MGTLSHAIAPRLAAFPDRRDSRPRQRRSDGIFSSASSRNSRSSASSRLTKKSVRVFAAIKHNQNIDFSDPDWKSKFQKEFEKRFAIPHITDVFPDDVSIPSTFCLKMRCSTVCVLNSLNCSRFWKKIYGPARLNMCFRTPVIEDFAGGYPSDEEWHGYINNNDRVLLKVLYFIPHFYLR